MLSHSTGPRYAKLARRSDRRGSEARRSLYQLDRLVQRADGHPGTLVQHLGGLDGGAPPHAASSEGEPRKRRQGSKGEKADRIRPLYPVRELQPVMRRVAGAILLTMLNRNRS